MLRGHESQEHGEEVRGAIQLVGVRAETDRNPMNFSKHTVAVTGTVRVGVRVRVRVRVRAKARARVTYIRVSRNVPSAQKGRNRP